MTEYLDEFIEKYELDYEYFCVRNRLELYTLESKEMFVYEEYELYEKFAKIKFLDYYLKNF